MGYQEMFEELERDLCEITGYDRFSFQSNRWVDAAQWLEKTIICIIYVVKNVCAFAEIYVQKFHELW